MTKLKAVKRLIPYIAAGQLLLALASPAMPASYSFDGILSAAIEKNPSVKKARLLKEQAKQSYYKAYSGFLPKLSAQAASSQGGSDDAGYSRQTSMGISGSLSLFSGFSDSSAVRIRKLELMMAEESYRRALSDMTYSLKRSFINLLWAQDTASLMENILSRRKENAAMIRLKYDSGTEDKGSLLRVEADAAQAEYSLEKARRSLKSASLELSMNAGLDGSEDISARGSIETPAAPAYGLLGRDVAHTPEYLSAKYAQERSRGAAVSAGSSFYPELSLNASTSKTGEEWLPGSNRWSAGISLSYPFFTGGSGYFDYRSSKLGEKLADEALAETKNQLAVKIDAAYNALLDAAGQVSVRAKYLEASETQSEITSEKYINGLSSYQDWYTIENDYINSRISLLNARRDAALSEAQLKNTLGD